MDLLNTYYEKEQIVDLLEQLDKNWLTLIHNHTVYGTIREAAVLPPNPDTESMGHSEDGHLELEGTIANLTLNNSTEFGRKVKTLETDEQEALLDVADMNVEALKEIATSDADRAEIDKRYSEFKAALR